MTKESVAGLHISQPNVDLEEMVDTLVESINEVLRIVDEARKDGVETNKNSNTVQGCLCRLREIIVSAIKNQEIANELDRDFSSLGMKLLKDGSLDIDRKTLKESISLSKGDITRVIKTITTNLFETLPLCIDPGSGTLVYTGKRLEDDGDEKASKVLAAIDEELEKERTELDTRLSVADSLIWYSKKLIDELKPQSEALLGEE
jgi:SHS2 domain-containing protein